MVSVPGQCVLETAEWRLSGLEEGQSTVHLQPPTYVPVPSLNLTWPTKITRKLQKQLSFIDRADVPLADLTNFKELDSAVPMNWQVTAPIIGYALLSIIVLVITVVVAFRMYQRYCRTIQAVDSTLGPDGPVATTKFLAADIVSE